MQLIWREGKISGGVITTHPKGQGNGAGIGGGNHSGAGGDITITGGTIYATGKNGAGIGGGRAHLTAIFEGGNGEVQNSGAGGTIRISGGEIHASSSNAFGIGAGGQGDFDDCYNDDLPENEAIGTAGRITISGTADVTAKGRVSGIGGDSGTVTINGGTVSTMGWEDDNNHFGEAFGSGIALFDKNAKVSINGGTVIATGYGIGPGLSSIYGMVSITGGTVYARAEGTGAGIGGWNSSMNDRSGDAAVNGKLEISGADTFVSAVSKKLPPVGTRPAEAYEKQSFVFHEGITVETSWSGKSSDYTAEKILYENARLTAGESREKAAILKAADRASAFANLKYKYILVAPCSHEGTMQEEEGVCSACGWKAGSYCVTYELDEGVISAVETVENGGKAQRPEDPTREGAAFNGWYRVLEGGALATEPYGFDAVVTEDITLRAVWVHRHDGITFRAWNADNALPAEAGSYCLTRDVTQTGVQYTLMQYFVWLENNGDDNEKAVGTAAKDYCTAAQIYFEYNVPDGMSVSDAVNEVTVEMLNSYIASRDGTLPSGVGIEGISAMLESDNALRLYFDLKNVDPDELSFAIDADNVVLKQRSDGKYYIALDEGVYSNHLQDKHAYSVSRDGETYTITASVLTYARSCAIKRDENVINLGKALYLYNKAAVAAFGG